MSVTAAVVLATARTLLNDDLATLWTDTSLMPKLAQAHRELQVKLRFAGAPVMRALAGASASSGTVTSPSDLVEPITIWETVSGTKVQLTEADPLPPNAGSGLGYWNWSITAPEVISFSGTSGAVTIHYWKKLTIPTSNSDVIGFINGEHYLSPRIAALAAGSVGNDKLLAWATSIADENLKMVILTNRGRLAPADGTSMRP